MATFKANLRKQTRVYFAIAALLLVVAIILLITGPSRAGEQHITDFISGMQAGIFTGFFGVAFTMAIRYGMACRNEKLLQKLYIAETDERNRFIRDKVGNTGMNLSIALLMAGAIVAGYFDEKVFATLIVATVGISLVKACLKLIYRKRY